MKQGCRRALFGYVLIFVLALLAAGCGGGGGDTTPPPPGGTPTPGGGGTTPTGAVVAVIANAGPIVGVRVGSTAILNGGASSNSTGGALTYAWSFTHKPDGSTAELQNATAVDPSFVPDVRGTYMIQLVVSAAGVSSQRAIALVEATVDPERLTGAANHAGLQSNCVACHDGTQISLITGLPIPGKSGDHIGTGNLCQACHSTFGFATVPFVDHVDIFGNCSECHDNITAIGKSSFHEVTDAECNDCHNTTHFLTLQPDGSFDHSTVSSVCTACHGRVATGKPVGVDENGNLRHPVTSRECLYCHTVASFIPAFVDHTSLTVNDLCGTCHVDGSATVTGKDDIDGGRTHPVTTADCRACHNIRTFVFDLIGNYDHTSVIETGEPRCDSCHNNDIATGLTDTHIPVPVGQDCGVCHVPGTFTSAQFDHTGIINNCASCHNGGTSVGKHVDHLPTTEDCSVCHSTTIFTSFAANITFSHVNITDNCASCHGRAPSAIGKTATHIPALDDCSVCHNDTNTGGFANSIFLRDVHVDIVRGCEGCHNGRFTTANVTVPGKPTTHLPTTQDCYLCHTVTEFIGAANFNHTGIASNCTSCHNGNVNNVAAGALGKTSVASGHPDTTADCGACHSTSNIAPNGVSFLNIFVDHTSQAVLSQRCDACHNGTTATGKVDAPTPHITTTQDCGVCHAPGGTFADAVFDHSTVSRTTRCDSCHGVTATGKDARQQITGAPHIPTAQDCRSCHNTTAFAGASFDHRGITNNCASCHNGVTTIGKTINHVPTNSDCSVCHQTTGFLPATFDHAGIVDNCQSCHDGVLATGKVDHPGGPTAHPATTADCGACHTTAGTFADAVFDHSNVTATTRCDSCHGVTATGKDAKLARTGTPHIATTLDCRNCHTTATFVGGIFDHQGITGNCVSCHNGDIATGQVDAPRPHLITGRDCVTCHRSTTQWAPVTYTHAPSNPRNGDGYPGNHRRNPGCAACHKQQLEIPWPAWTSNTQLQGYCGACHESFFERDGHHIGGNNGTVVQNRDCGNSGCHSVNSNGF